MILVGTPLGDLRISNHILERNEQRLGLSPEQFLRGVMKSRPCTRKEFSFYVDHRVVLAPTSSLKLLVYKEHLYLVEGQCLITILLIPAYIARLGSNRQRRANDVTRTSDKRKPYDRSKERQRKWI